MFINSYRGEFLILKNRLNGQLALSRSIGDLKYRPAVTSEAEIQTINLGSLDQYLILASDGVCSKVYSTCLLMYRRLEKGRLLTTLTNESKKERLEIASLKE